METGYIIALIIACLVAGGIVGGIAFSSEIEIPIPTDCPNCPDCPIDIATDCPLPDPVLCEICSAIASDLKDEAVANFLEEVEDNEKLLRCGGEEFDLDQIEIKRIYDEWSTEYDEDDYVTSLTIKLKYLDGDVEDKCYKTFDVTNEYDAEDDEFDTNWIVV